MASIFSKIGELFKKKDQAPQQTTQPVQTTQPAQTQQTPSVNVFKPSMTAQKGSSGKKETVDVGFKPISYNEFSPGSKVNTSIDWRSLSERSKANDAANGVDWSNASARQKQYNDTYYKTLDDPTHTKMYRDLESASRYGKDATKEYRANRDALDDELDRIAKEKGKSSDEYRALQKFVDDYTELGRQAESSRANRNYETYSQRLDDNIQQIYGGLMGRPDFQTKVAEGLAEAKKHPAEYADLKTATENATQAQKDLIFYLRATEGKEGVERFMASGLGQLLTAANASRVYANQVANDSDFLRGAAAFGQQVESGLTSLVSGAQKLYRGLTGKDADDPTDRNLGGGYTISDSTDDYLRTIFNRGLADAGISDSVFTQAAAEGLDKISGRTEKSSWAKDIMDNATPYQQQLLGFLYIASGKDAVKETWEGIKQRDQMVWDAVKKGSNKVASDVGDYLAGMYVGYANLGGNEIPSWLAGSGGEDGDKKTLEGMLLEGTRSAAQQIVPMFAGAGVGNAFTAAGASRAAAATAGRIAAAAPMATTIGGQSYEDALSREGVTRKDALGYAVTEAALEFVTDQMLGIAGGYGGKLTGGLQEKVAARIASPVLRALNTVGVSSLGEGYQEYLQEALEPIVTSVFLHEGDLSEAIEGFASPTSWLDPDRLYSGALGVLTSLAMSPGSVAVDINNNRYFTDLGKAMGDIDALAKTADVILNADLSSVEDLDEDAFEEAKKTAQLIKNGSKVSDLAAGKMIVDFGKAGGDLSHLARLETQSYNKDTLTPDDLLAGATSMLVDLGGDVELADAIVKAATNQALTQEQLEAIQNDQAAVQVLSQLLGELDMTQDTALSRAARSTTMKSTTGNKVYDTLKAENTSKTVVTPVSQRLYNAGGMSLNEAEQISGVIEKVMNGTAITEDEAELITVSNAAVRSMLRDVVGVELDEDATIGRIMDTLNDVAANMASVKEMQSDIRQNAEQVAKARMPIPPAQTRSTITLGDSEYSHDEFVKDYMNQHGVSQAVAEQAWQQRATVDAALSGEEESNGTRTIPGNPEGRHVDLAAGGQVRGVQERDTGSGRAPVARGAESSGRENSLGTRTNSTPIQGAEAEEVITKLNAKQRDFVKECKDDGFESVTLVKGPLLYAKADGTRVEVNALVNGRGDLVIRWDNPRVSPYKVANHERIHRWLGQFTDAERAKYVSDALYEIFGEGSEEFTAIYDIYTKKYGSAYGDLSGLAFQNAIFEEIFADLYAGMDLYNAGTAQFQQQAEMYVENTNLRGQFFGEESTSETNYGESFERFNLADPFRESTDWDIPSDVRPFPGEEPMHEQMDRFSVSSMAEGGNFDLLFNESGQPYALVNKDTGERVTEVTADMMSGTPLGDVVQMAVDNGSITEDEAKIQRQMLADAMNLIVKYNDAAVVWELAGSQLFSAIKSNSDKQYNKTIDFSTICKKTMAIVDAMSETMKRLGRGLTRREVEAVYLETGKAGEATPCPVCYVFSRWMGIGNLLDQMSKFQDKYAGKSEEELVSFMQDIEDRARAYAAAASKTKQEEFYDKNGNLKIGKVISDMKSKPNSSAASAIKKLNQHQQANDAIAELTRNLPNATPEQAARWNSLIKVLKRNVLKDSKIAELQEQMAQADAAVEDYEVYQWLAKTVLMSDASQVNEDGEAIGNWKKNPNFKPVPKDILFDLNRGGDFAKDYPLSWAFRTGKGCAMGKAITPYADARVGETIQGVAMDVKNIRVGGEINEFLNGDVKKQQKTLESARKKQKQQNLIGGMRYQSTSGFRYEFGSDYLMTFFEMQALGANVQLYTKVIESVDFLASTGADCNLSVMPLGDGYVIDPKTGKKKLAFSNVTGINAEAAIKKAKQYDNVQLILVGINDENIRLALEGTDVTFVIPFHGSGQSVHQVQTLMDLLGEHLDVTQAQDYTSVQSDHVSPKQTAEQKAMWDLRVDIITGKCADGLTTEQQALLAKNQHLQKLYNMFYVDETAPAYQNFLGKDQAEQIFPYEYWNREGDYEHADENGRTFQEYCKSMGIIPRFSGINSKGERVGFGDFTKDKGYWKLLIDRSMYENVYDENGDWIGYGKYRDQQQINMSNVKLSDLDPETGKAQFTNGEMSKQYDATHSEADRQNLDTIVTNSIQRIEAMRDKGDVFDKTQVNKGFRTNIMKANAEIRGMDDVRASAAGGSRKYDRSPRTFAKDRNARGVFSANELIDLTDSDADWTGTRLYATMSMNEDEMRQFHEAIDRLTKDMPEYGTGETIEPIQDVFSVTKNGRQYRYLVELDGRMHGQVLQKWEVNIAPASTLAKLKETKNNANRERTGTGRSLGAGRDAGGPIRGGLRAASVGRQAVAGNDRLAANESGRYSVAGFEEAESRSQGESNGVTESANARTDIGDGRSSLGEEIEPVITPEAAARETEDTDVRFSIRSEDPPKKTKIGYKVFKAFKDDPGQLYPTKVDNPGGQGTPLGVWLNADTGELARNKDGSIKTNSKGRIKVKADGGELAWRPGWHLGELPEANQMNRNDPNNPGADRVSEGVMHDNYIFCECEFAADEDYQLQAFQMGFNEKGGYAHSQAGLPYIPKDGYYKYRTNPDPNTAPWYISGAIKITKILDDNMRREIIEKWNAEHPDEPPMRIAPRYGGRDIDLSEYGFTAGPVTPTEELDSIAPGVDYSDEIKDLPGYKPSEINWDNASFQDAFRINGIEDRREELRQKYEAGDIRLSAAADDTNSDNPYKEGSFESMAFDLLKKAQNPQELQDWINDLRQKQADAKEAGKLKAPVIPSADKATPVNKTQQKIRENQLAKLIEKYGAFKQGEKAARNQPIPEKISDDRRVRRYVRTAAEAEATPQRLAERIGGETLVNELLSYTPITDSDAVAGANHEFNRLGYKKALKAWQSKSGTDHFPTKGDIAFGSRLMVEAMHNGDDAVAMQTLADLAAMETQAGQVAQAARLLKQLGPSGQLYYVQKAVDRLNHQNEGRIAKGTMDPIIIDQDLAKAVMLAETQEEMDKAMEALKQDIADKLPINLKDRWDAWRYLAMLGNPRTHVRNYLGNWVFSPVRFTKDLLAAAGEKMFIQDESQRTKDAKALMKDPRYNEIRQFAEEDFKVMEPDLTGDGKMNPLNEIMGMRKVLPGILDKASRKNDDLLKKEDVIFLRKAYVNALTQYIAARGLSLEDLSSGSFESNKLMNEARRYAALEAQKATYRDFSRVAAALNSLRRAAPGLSPLLDGLMPFTKTPINILKRGLEYSPAGLAKVLLIDLKKVQRGDLTAAEAIDHAAAGMTGTGVALLGWLLASLGMARGGADDDDKKDKLEKAQGHQDYSLEIGGKSYTIDWMAPVALPFFVGVEAYNQLTGEGQASFMDFVNAVTLIAEPMMSLSMLDGINSTLSAVRSGSNSPIQSVATNILASYISQGAPTLLGQIARTIDPDRRSTYVDKNSENPAFMQRFVQNLQGKVPVLSSQKMAYIDTWGRKDTNESIILRGLENFISPGYANRVNETPVDTELLRLAEATGNNKVLPSEAAKYFQVEGETLNLNAKQYEQYKTTTGQTAFKLLGDLFADPVYAAMDDAQKANAVEQAMKIATAIGKQDVAPTYKTDGWIQRAIDHDNLETASMFHMLKNAETGLSNYQLISAMDWLNDEEKGELVMQEHPNTYRQMTDYTRKGYKFTLTDENIAREREIYESLFWPAYNELVSGSKFQKASVAKQADMLSKMQSSLGTEARKRLGKELRAAGIKSHKPSDADVPDNVTNLYDLLNRP